MLKRISIDGFDLHNLLGSPHYQVYVDGVDGLGEPQMRVTVNEKSGEDGGTVPSTLLGPRPISFRGEVRSTSAAEFMADRRALQSACSPKRDINNRPVPRRLSFTDLADNDYFVDVFTRGINVPTRYNQFADFLLQFIAAEAAIFVDDAQTTGQVSRPVGGGVIYPVTYPAIYGASTGGTVAAFNEGTTDSWPIITLRGPALNPVVVHQGLGISVALNVTLGADDVVVIDMKEHSIVLNGTTNYIPYLVSGSDWFYLTPGYNVLSFSTGLSTDTGTMKGDFYPALLAV